jgi:hypothetical protein
MWLKYGSNLGPKVHIMCKEAVGENGKEKAH